MKVLYDSGAVHDAIKKVLTKSSTSDRRVVAVAYIGEAADKFLPSPDGLEIICCLQPGATSALALERLRKRGAKLFHSPKLHMKVYWSSTNGCVIGSANASASALAKGGLKEAGVLLATGRVDIQRMIDGLDAKPITKKDLLTLQKETDRFASSGGAFPPNVRIKLPSLIEWSKLYAPKSWKLGWFTDAGEIASTAIAEARNRYGVPDVHDAVNCTRDQYKQGDWVLYFNTGESKPHPGWLYVDFVVEVDAKDDKAYDMDYPFQAVQVHPQKRYPYPPFEIGSAKFRRALELTMKDFGATAIEGLASMSVPRRFLNLLLKNWSKG
jgi:hypothetical protein